MADFTFLTDLSRNQDLVRFHTSDTDPNGFWLADTTINALLTGNSQNVGLTVVAALRFIIMMLSRPNFKADWLLIDNAVARKGFEGMLEEKKREFGVGAGRPTSGSTNVYRSDSRTTSAPDYTDYGAQASELASLHGLGGSGSNSSDTDNDGDGF